MEPEPLALLEFVSLDGVLAQIASGQTIRATARWRNTSPTPIFVTQAVITGRAPGATHEGGPYDDFTPAADLVEVAPDAILEVSASLLPRVVFGDWEAYPAYKDEESIWHDSPGVMFKIVADQDYGSFENLIWPVADPADPPNDDRRFAFACYTKSTLSADSALCRARYGLGTLPYQVSPSNLPTIQQQCEQDGGIFLNHACPTNQMLQLCWEDTRSPAWSFACEYYGDPNNKSPQQPGAAPDIIFYNDDYRGRDPQP
jgi:hypothetical protein